MWSTFAPENLPDDARKMIEDPGNTVYVSCVTYWEISLKYALEKLTPSNTRSDALPGIAARMQFDSLDSHEQNFYRRSSPINTKRDFAHELSVVDTMMITRLCCPQCIAPEGSSLPRGIHASLPQGCGLTGCAVLSHSRSKRTYRRSS